MRELSDFEKELAGYAQPISWKVLMLMESVDEFAGEAQMIIKTEMTKDREQISQDKGRVIAMGPTAFQDPEVFGEKVPVLGDRVLLNRHSGGRILGFYQATGKVVGAEGFKKEEIVELDVRIVNDKDINNILTEDKKVIFKGEDNG